MSLSIGCTTTRRPTPGENAGRDHVSRELLARNGLAPRRWEKTWISGQKKRHPLLVSARVDPEGSMPAARRPVTPKWCHRGPQNPLGEYKMRLAVGEMATYEIHGTNNPVAVGLAVTPWMHSHVRGGRRCSLCVGPDSAPRCG